MSAFLDLGLSPDLIESLPFHLPTPVQAESIPLILGGGDVCVSAETGSGKTAAFGLSCTQIVHEVKSGKCSLPALRSPEAADSKGPLCVVVTPTNPLVDQTVKVLREFSSKLTKPQVKVASEASDADILIGTPQKIKSMYQSKKISFSRVLFLVLDEADELIKNDKERVLNFLNEEIKAASVSRVQTLLFSATLKTPEVQRGITLYCTNPVWVDTSLGDQLVPSTVDHAVVLVDLSAVDTGPPSATAYTDKVHTDDQNTEENNSRLVKVRKLMMLVEVADKMKMDRCMVFCRTNVDCDNLEKFLLSLDQGKVGAERGKEHKYSCCVLAGFREAAEKRRNLELFQEGGIRFLICTDVAARGVDIKGLPFLINMTLPDDCDNYVHRIGRVGRAERMGLALSFVSTVKEKVWFHANCKNRGRDGCVNRNLVSQGGCCVWYDEPTLIKNVEKKIKSKIPLFDLKTLSVVGKENSGDQMAPVATKIPTPQGRTALKLAALKVEKSKVVYGEQRGNPQNEGVGFGVPPAVAELMVIESELQKLYLKGFGSSPDPAPAAAAGAGATAAAEKKRRRK